MVNQDVPMYQQAIPIPAAYDRNLFYKHSNPSPESPHTDAKPTELKQDISATDTEVGRVLEKEKDEERHVGKRQKSVLIFLRDSQIYIRILAILIMMTSFSLILAAVVKYDQAKEASGQPLDAIPKPPLGITDYPCRVYVGIAGMNLSVSIVILSLSCVSSKFRKGLNAINALFALLGAIGFASSMSACFFLKKQVNLKSDLWKWSCDNHRKGVSTPALDFEVICHVVDYGWKFGLVQASLDLLTFIVSVTAFFLLKYSYLVRYGAVGKVF